MLSPGADGTHPGLTLRSRPRLIQEPPGPFRSSDNDAMAMSPGVEEGGMRVVHVIELSRNHL
jgi:hypothetical protein